MSTVRLITALAIVTACNVSDAQAAADASEVDPTEASAGIGAEEADRFVGNYGFAGGEAQRTALREAIEDLVAQLNVLIQKMARTKITETNPVFETIAIERNGGELTLTYGTLRNTCRLDGSASTVKGIDGDDLTCRLSMNGNALVHSVNGSRGGRVNTFTIGENGRLKMKTRIHSKLMPADLRYTLTFARR